MWGGAAVERVALSHEYLILQGCRIFPRLEIPTIASPLHNAFLRCLQPRGAIVLDPVPACDKLGSSRIDDRHELLPGDRRSPSTTVVTIGGERHLLGPAPVLSRLSCFITPCPVMAEMR